MCWPIIFDPDSLKFKERVISRLRKSIKFWFAELENFLVQNYRISLYKESRWFWVFYPIRDSIKLVRDSFWMYHSLFLRFLIKLVIVSVIPHYRYLSVKYLHLVEHFFQSIVLRRQLRVFFVLQFPTPWGTSKGYDIPPTMLQQCLQLLYNLFP